MGYLNPIERIGYENFSSESKESGVDGVLVVDLPHEEAQDIVNIFKKDGLDSIFLIAPNSTQERILNTLKYASGFLYYVSLKGITGAELKNFKEVKNKVKKIKSLTNLPVVVGFGIKDKVTAKKMASFSDGIVVGTKIIDFIEKKSSHQISSFTKSLKKAIN